MHILFSLIFSFSVFGAELIVDHTRISELSSRLSRSNYNNYKRVSPFFSENGLPKVVVEKFKRCLKLHFYQNSIRYSKTNCDSKIQYSLVNFPGYKSIGFQTSLEDQNVLLKEESVSKKYRGVSFKYFLRDLHIAKLEDFSFELIAQSFFKSTKGKIELIQKLKFVRDEFHFFPLKEKVTTQTIDLKKGDILFQKSNTEFIIYKRYQPKPLDFRFLWLNPAYDEYLSNVDSLLFNDSGSAYCFMDYHIDPSLYDCEKLALGEGLYKQYNQYSLILIDLRGSISIR